MIQDYECFVDSVRNLMTKYEFTLIQIHVFVLLPDNGGHDLCGKEDAEGGSGLGGEETQHREHCDGRLTEICGGRMRGYIQ